MNSQLNWQKVFDQPNAGNGRAQSTLRAEVPGGWIYRHVNQFSGGSDVKIVETMVFVPDPEKK
jgi:hypothetical protein